MKKNTLSSVAKASYVSTLVCVTYMQVQNFECMDYVVLPSIMTIRACGETKCGTHVKVLTRSGSRRSGLWGSIPGTFVEFLSWIVRHYNIENFGFEREADRYPLLVERFEIRWPSWLFVKM